MQTHGRKQRALIISAASMALLLTHRYAAAAPITFNAPTTITGDSDVFNLGSTLYAYDWNNISTTVNAVPFTGTSSITGSGDGNIGMVVSGSGVIANSLAGYTTTKTPFASLSAAYKSILSGGDYDNHTPGGDTFTLTLNNLTVGHAYALQAWANDPRPKAGRNVSLTSTGGNSVKLTYSATNTAGVPGQFTVGGFVADGITQSFNATGGTTTSSLNTQINAVQLRDVTGIWSGSVNGNWDSITTNFTGSMNFTAVSSIMNTVTFADTDGFDNPITNSAINIQPGGVSIASTVFQNNNVNYTLTGSDAIGITGPGNVLKTGAGQLTLLSSNTYSGGTNVSAGVLIGSSPSAFGTGNLTINPTGTTGTTADAATVYSNASIAPTAAVTVNTNSTTAVGTLVLQSAAPVIGSLAGSGTVVLANTSGSVLTVGANNASTLFAGDITDDGSGNLVKLGAGNFTLTGSNTYVGYTNVSAGTLTVGSAKALPPTTNLNIAAGAMVVVSNLGLPTAIAVSNISGGGTLNLNNNALVIHTGSLSAINSMVSSGYSGGSWNGPSGIVSTNAASDSTRLTAVGVIVNDDGTGTNTPLYGASGSIAATFDGSSPVEGDVLVKYTYYGDTNLDGKIDGSDYSRIDNGFLTGATGWFNGDFNYDGVINGSDYTLIDNTFNSQGAALTDIIASPQATATAQIAVPEPASLSIALLGLATLRRRNRRT